MNDLLPCPFCGGHAKTKLPYVRCTECGAQMCFGETDADDSAISSWNRRAALSQQRAVPEGWVLVPREPTEAMLSAAHYELADKPFSNNAERSVRAYAAMLAAAPQPPAEAQPVAWRETVERLADGLYSKRHDARERGDKYDEGYFGAMLKDAETLLEATPPSAPVGAGVGDKDCLTTRARELLAGEYRKRGIGTGLVNDAGTATNVAIAAIATALAAAPSPEQEK